MIKPLWMTFLILFLTAGSAPAHRVNVFAYQDGDAVEVEASFPGGRPCVDCTVAFIDPATSKQIRSGRTDAKGQLRVPVPAPPLPAGLEVVLEAGQGHRASWVLLPEDMTPSAEPDSAAGLQAGVPEPEIKQVQTLDNGNSITLDKGELVTLIDQAVSRQLAPLKRMLLKEREPDPRNIVGSIGYLVGIAGIVAWMRSRRKA
ncbi:MAG TPA: hypothetical protein VJ934_07745 [Desulfomicrobiaceae bacterium]|nr:hypothetical protein [Desulfomicrobiaceae bacterium]